MEQWSEEIKEAITVRLLQKKLAMINFVHDYITLSFGDLGLACYTLPFLLFNQQQWKRSDFGYCDILCNCVDYIVTSIEFKEQAFEFTFSK